VAAIELASSPSMEDLDRQSPPNENRSLNVQTNTGKNRNCGCSYRCMQWAARVAFVLILTLILVAAGVIIWQIVVKHAENHIVAWFVGGIFTLLCVVSQMGPAQ